MIKDNKIDMEAYMKKFTSRPKYATIGKKVLAIKNPVNALVITTILPPIALTLKGNSSVLMMYNAGPNIRLTIPYNAMNVNISQGYNVIL